MKWLKAFAIAFALVSMCMAVALTFVTDWLSLAFVLTTMGYVLVGLTIVFKEEYFP